jgi:hypothetical protein
VFLHGNKQRRRRKCDVLKMNILCMDCVFCYDPQGFDGIAKTIFQPLNPNLGRQGYSHIPNDYNKNHMKCKTCTKQFCGVCKGEFKGLGNNSPDNHSGKTCADRMITIRASEMGQDPSEALIARDCKNCPSCQAPVYRIEGCNHMVCRCNTHFCYLCESFLNPADPYSHYDISGPNGETDNNPFGQYCKGLMPDSVE